MIGLINVTGFGKNGNISPLGHGRSTGTRGKGDKEEKKVSPDRKNTDKADFSSYLNKEEQAGSANKGGLRVGQKSDKADGLSENAKKYLEKLKKKYGNMDFIIADYSTDEEAEKLLSSGKGEYNVLITPDLLEKMAAEGSAAAEYEGLIESSVAGIDSIKEGLGEDADMIDKFGVAIDGNGNVTFSAKLIEGLTAKDGSQTVKGNTVDEMLSLLSEAKEEQTEKLAKLREERAAKNEETTADTDDADKEVRTLKNSRQKLMSQIRAEQNSEKRSELEEMLRQLENEITVKDSESYRRSHTHFSTSA